MVFRSRRERRHGFPFETGKHTPKKGERGYWEAIYTRLDIGPHSGRQAYSESWMGRGCTLLHCAPADLVVGTTHLESLEAAEIRRDQAGEAVGWLESVPVHNRVLMGDMNLYENESLGSAIPDSWSDVWARVHPDDEGYTWDPTRNTNLKGGPRSRLDRIFMNCPDYVPVKLEMVGDQPIEGVASPFSSYELPVFPSDHFGLYLELARRPASAPGISRS